MSNMDFVWRPSLPISTDGKPLAVETTDLLWTFPYDRLVSENTVVSWLLRPEVVFCMVLAYMASKPLLSSLFEKPLRSKSFTLAVAIHNLALAVFSLVVAVNAWAIVLMEAYSRGIKDTYCDSNGEFWLSSGFGAWATIFYLSKYYEFVDTWILILKGKQPSFLQLYHHVGIVISMWGGVVSHSSWLVIVVLLNSVIHTFMYTYFFYKTWRPQMELKAAKYLTLAQIGQFIFGIMLQTSFIVGNSSCDSPASQFMCAFIIAYAVGLILLFSAFASKKYKRARKKKQL